MVTSWCRCDLKIAWRHAIWLSRLAPSTLWEVRRICKWSKMQIINYLNKLLETELVAINQYFLHARKRVYKNQSDASQWLMSNTTENYRWGNTPINMLVERILFLEELPTYRDLGKLGLVKDVVEEMLQSISRIRTWRRGRISWGYRACWQRSRITC